MSPPTTSCIFLAPEIEKSSSPQLDSAGDSTVSQLFDLEVKSDSKDLPLPSQRRNTDGAKLIGQEGRVREDLPDGQRASVWAEPQSHRYQGRRGGHTGGIVSTVTFSRAVRRMSVRTVPRQDNDKASRARLPFQGPMK